MESFQAHRVLILCPDTFVLHPETLVHGLEDGFCLLLVGLGILSDDFGNAGSELVTSIVIGRGVGHGSTTIV